MLVTLTCIKVGSKLKVRILTDGYIRNANCQFPRDIRVEGALYSVDSEFINLVTSRGRYFYSIKKKDKITTLNGPNAPVIDTSNLTIYEDAEESDCAICLSSPKDTVFAPCGHYYCCSSCSVHLKICPICRGNIVAKVSRSLVD